jgi:hypothetical protein
MWPVTIIDELNMSAVISGSLSEKHVHTLWDALKNAERLSPKIITALNRTRINIFHGPIKHAHNVSIKDEKTKLNFYTYPVGPPGRVKAKTYREFYEKECTFVSLSKRYISELKEMYYWFEKAVLTAWAEFTDQFATNRKMAHHTGLKLLEIPDSERKNLNLIKKHFRELGIKTCAYCYKRAFNETDLDI